MNRTAAVALLALTLTSAPAWAQAPAAPRTATLGGGSATGPLLSREELRACLKRPAELAPRRAEVEAQTKQIEAEKLTLLAEMESLKSERRKIDEIGAVLKDDAARRTALSARVAQFNERAKAIPEQRRNMTPGEITARERELAALKQDQEELVRDTQALDAERTRLGSQDEMVRSFNTRAVAQDRRIDDWNARNDKFTALQQTLKNDLDDYTTNCANRRYREDDEDAIRRGQ